VQEHFHDLVVGTYGRGFYILDDVTPLEQLTDAVRAETAHLFTPRPAYRFRRVAQPNLAPGGTSAGKNPAYGALVNYWLKSPVKVVDKTQPEDGAVEGASKRPVEIAIFDSAGRRVRSLTGTNKAGLNRVSWDLREEPTVAVRLRTTPAGNPQVWEEKRFRGKDARGVFYYGIWDTKRGPLVPPGTYTVKLTVDGKEFPGESLVVLKDPNSAGTQADVEASTKLSIAIYRDTNAVARMINQIEWTRRQLEDFRKMLKARKADADDLAAADALEKSARAVEDKLLQPTLAEADEKSFRGPLELYLKLLWLQAEVGAGGADVSGGADFAPTRAELEVYDLLSGQLAQVRRGFEELYGTSIPAFNESMRAKGLVQLMTVLEPEEPRSEAAPEEDDEDWPR
jgi:hypothetical protein